jgi:hypothetical protein
LTVSKSAGKLIQLPKLNYNYAQHQLRVQKKQEERKKAIKWISQFISQKAIKLKQKQEE